MSVAAGALGARAVADQDRDGTAGTGGVPPKRKLVAKADATLIPELR